MSPSDTPTLEQLARALEDDAYRESLLSDSFTAPIARFLRRAGAFFRPACEEIDFTDWNGALVGRGAGAETRAAIAPDPELPFAELEPLLLMGSFARELVARHPSTPTGVLLTLAEDPELTCRPVETKEQLDAQANDSDASVRWVVARRPTLPEDVMEKLAGDPDDGVRCAIANRKAITPGAIARIIEHELAPKIIAALAENPATPPSVLARLSNLTFPAPPASAAMEPWPTTTAEVRALIARRSSLPREMVLEYARDEDYRVREAIAQNPSTDPAILVRKQAKRTLEGVLPRSRGESEK